MLGRSSNVLGLAFSERAIACAELSVQGTRRSVRHTAVFSLGAEASYEQPRALGEALASFLKEKGFTATRAVVGVPARWLFAVEKELPPASEETAAATLRLQAERLAIAESGEVVCDFVGKTSTSAASRVLLVGMLKTRLAHIEQVIEAAELSLEAVTSNGLAVASCAARTDGDGPLLVLAPSGAEMVVRSGGSPRMLRHVPFTMNGHGVPPIAPLGPELRRAVTLSPGDKGREMLLVDAIGVRMGDVKELSERIGIGVRSTHGLQLLGITPPAAGTNGDAEHPAMRFAVPLSLALAGSGGSGAPGLPLNFRDSRLAVAPPRRFSRPMVWGVLLGVALLIGIASLFWSVQSEQSELDTMTATLAKMKPDLKDAQARVDRAIYGRGFFQPYRTPVLDCLRAITESFRDQDRIWASSFSIRETGRNGILAGRAADQKTVRDLSDRMKQSGHFSDVKLQDMREADPRTHEQTFSIAFEFKG
jgi:Tfp pilus assembly protein PilN